MSEERDLQTTLVIYYTAKDSNMLQQAADILEGFPTVHFKLFPASEVDVHCSLFSRMRIDNNIIDLAAIEAASVDDPMMDENEEGDGLIRLMR